jgi:hypothetical protein
MKLTDTIILTTGSDAEGGETNTGGRTKISGGSVTTSGAGSIGIFATGSAEADPRSKNFGLPVSSLIVARRLASRFRAA